MRLLILAVFLVLVSGCQKTVAYKTIKDSPYLQVEGTPFDRFLVKDKNAFSRYEKIIFSALKFDQLNIQSSHDTRIDRTWDLTVEDKLIYANYFKDELLEIYSGEHAAELFGLGTGRDDQTLYAEVRLLNLRPMVAKHGEKTSGTISQKTIESFGSLTVQIMLVDSVTHEFIAVIEDGRDLTASAQVKSTINRATDAYVWRRTFESYLKDLKNTLVNLKGPEVAHQ